MKSTWTKHVKQFAESNGMSFKDAMSCAPCKEEWQCSKCGAGLSSSKIAPIDRFDYEQQYIIDRRNKQRYIARKNALINKAIDDANRKADSDLSKEHKQRLRRYKLPANYYD